MKAQKIRLCFYIPTEADRASTDVKPMLSVNSTIVIFITCVMANSSILPL
jgi:hypothetical protein